MYIWASPKTRQHHSVPLNADQKFITFIRLPNSGLFYKSKWGTHSEPSSLKPARKEVNGHLPLSSLGSGVLLASWWAGSINTHCFPFAFLLGERALKFWERERKRPTQAPSLQTSASVPSPLISWSSLRFLLLFFLAGLLPSKPFDKVCVSKLQQDSRRRNSAYKLGNPIMAPEWFLLK